MSPFNLLRKLGKGMGGRLLRGAVNRRLASASDEEKEALYNYLLISMSMPASTETAIFICFATGLRAHMGLESDERLGSLDLPVSCFHGNRGDWTH